jgi:translation initiation factor 1
MGIVWDSERGRTCPVCQQAAAACRCKRAEPDAGGDGIVRLRLEKSGRKGKSVTVITGLPAGDGLTVLVKALKQCCGSGGAIKDGVVEIQGDHRDKVRAELVKRAFVVRG